jgi:hypothetical protein
MPLGVQNRIAGFDVSAAGTDGFNERPVSRLAKMNRNFLILDF